jgi:CheY-like chemotaxis protein
MTTILVVDDSAVDRNLVVGLLGKDPSFKVDCAINGRDALAKMEMEIPDLVVTDLIMPEMDGLSLVSAVRQRFRLVPVILMTSKGSEELAVQALDAGAASYVPKRILAQRLLDTVHNVLAVSWRRQGHIRLMGSMTESESTFVLENDPNLIGPLVTYVQEDCTHIGLCGATERTRLGVALEEALTNALYHGNLEIGSELREHDEKAYWALAKQRVQEEPYRDRRIHVTARMSRDRGVFDIRDEGPGFDPSSLPDPTDPANLEKVSGRGVLLMRAFMDDVRFNEVGNCVTLVKLRDFSHPASGGDTY